MKIIKSIDQLLELSGKRIGFFSNTFNPPHFGHLDFIKKATSIKKIDHIILCPQHKDEHIQVEELKLRMRIMDLILETNVKTDILVLNQEIYKGDKTKIFMDDILYLLKRRKKELFVLAACNTLEQCAQTFESHDVTFIIGCRVKRNNAEKRLIAEKLNCIFIDNVIPCNAKQLANDIKKQSSYLSPELIDYIESNKLYWYNSECKNCN